MPQLHEFVSIVESEISVVLRVLQSLVRDVSKVYEHLANDQVLVEKRKPCSDLISENEDLRRLSLSLQKIIIEFDFEIKKTLALAGVKIDSIRTKIIKAKLIFQSEHDAEPIFKALNLLVSELDNLCDSLERNIHRISETSSCNEQ